MNTEDAELVERVAVAIERADNDGGYEHDDLGINHPEVSDWGIHLALAALTASGISRVEEENVRLRALLDAACPEEPMNQDEQGGCVWCDGSSNMWRRKHGDMNAGADPRDHMADCAWVAARAALAQDR